MVHTLLGKSEVAILQPVICSKIHTDPLCFLAFREDGILSSDSTGLIRIWDTDHGSRITEKLGKKRPIARILKESGRHSNNAIFVVGIFIESEKISEGYGDSLAMAEIRATKRALEDHFLQVVKDIKLPSLDLDEEEVTFFEK